MHKKAKKILRHPAVLSIEFVLLYFIAALVVPNRFPAASIIEVLLASAIFSYAYVKFAHEVLSKKQKLWICSVFFAVYSVAAAIMIYVIQLEDEGFSEVGIVPLSLIAILVIGLASVAAYLFLGLFSNYMKAFIESRK